MGKSRVIMSNYLIVVRKTATSGNVTIKRPIDFQRIGMDIRYHDIYAKDGKEKLVQAIASEKHIKRRVALKVVERWERGKHYTG